MAEIRGGLSIIDELAIGTVDGVNTLFMTSKKYAPNSLQVFQNGQKLIRNVDYTEVTDQSFTLTEAPLDTLSYTDRIQASYEAK